MILDSRLIFAWQQAYTAAAATAYSASTTPASQGVLDLGTVPTSTNSAITNPNRNIGVGTMKLYLVVLCTLAMTDIGSDSTATPSLRTSATITGAIGTNPALNGTVNTLQTLPAFAALSAIGTMLVAPLVPATYLQYIDVYMTMANGNLTTGSFSSWLATDVDLQTYYAEGFNPQ